MTTTNDINSEFVRKVTYDAVSALAAAAAELRVLNVRTGGETFDDILADVERAAAELETTIERIR